MRYDPSDFLNHLESQRNQIESYLPATSRDLANKIKDEAVSRAPEQTGALKRSARVAGDGGTHTITFHAPHALTVHEEPSFERESGEPRFLANAVTQVFDRHFPRSLSDLLKPSNGSVRAKTHDTDEL